MALVKIGAKISGETRQPFRRVGQAKRTHAVVIEVTTNAWVRFA
jgi:hypothetical protein